MKLKDPSVSLIGVHWTMFKAALVAEQLYKKYGEEVVITSANDGKHMPHSLHYLGKAIDLRTWSLNGREKKVADELRKALEKDYDVVLEKDHIHVEWDPK